MIQGQFQPFQSVSAVSVNFGHQPIRPNSGQIGLVRHESKPSRHESELSQHESKKKKNSGTAPTRRQPRRWLHPSSDSGAAPSQPRQCFTDRNWINMNAHIHNTLITNKKGWPSIEKFIKLFFSFWQCVILIAILRVRLVKFQWSSSRNFRESRLHILSGRPGTSPLEGDAREWDWINKTNQI